LPFKCISDLVEDNPEECILIGTLFKNMTLKPSILKEIAEENQLVPLPQIQNYNDATDDVVLEDEVQRVKLVGNVDIKELVSGIVAGVVGESCLNFC
jgi:DNA polymerase delta subunit 2